MSEDIDLNEDLKQLAHKMLEDAAKDGVKLAERLEVFKILGNYSVNLSKVKGKNVPPDPGTGPNMGALRGDIDRASSAESPSEPEEEEEEDDR